jgi:tetratricopeptide (TPR) repeat protein
MDRRLAVFPLLGLAFAIVFAAQNTASDDRLARHRNLGKAFYENPTTQNEAVEQFEQALKLAPDSPRERLNYALALLRAGKTDQGVAELEKVQAADASLPHTWFNLGIAYKKAGEHERAAAQFERMIQLDPADAISHYNLGSLYRILGRAEDAIRHFELAAKLDRTLAAPHFQLFNLYRTAGRAEDSRRELAIFQQLKKSQEGAAIPEDVEWNMYAEVYDVPAESPTLAASEIRFGSGTIPGAATGVAAIDVQGTGRPQLLLWSSSGIRLEPGSPIADIADTIAAAPGDFNNDGWQDVAVLTKQGPVLFLNEKGKLVRYKADLPAGSWRALLWVDYDHDYDLDLFLLGDRSE